jgi:hypothetical protein
MHVLFFVVACVRVRAAGMPWNQAMPPGSVAWIWGSTIPSTPSWFGDVDKTVSETFPDHGIVDLQFLRGTLEINLVKRPPAEIWNPSEKFCSHILPAAIYTMLTEYGIDVASEVELVHILFDADPYIAACKCYMRVLVEMGFTQVVFMTVNSDSVDGFCGSGTRKAVHLRPGRDEVPRLPSVSPEQMELLATANFVFETLSRK